MGTHRDRQTKRRGLQKKHSSSFSHVFEIGTERIIWDKVPEIPRLPDDSCLEVVPWPVGGVKVSAGRERKKYTDRSTT